jgi:NADPH:quinone reductase-like Zn-dependent oxidoreductase
VTVPSGVPEGLAERAAERGVRVTGILVEPDHAALERIAVLVDAGRLEVLVEEEYPLARAAAAHEHGERARTTGKLVLTV